MKPFTLASLQEDISAVDRSFESMPKWHGPRDFWITARYKYFSYVLSLFLSFSISFFLYLFHSFILHTGSKTVTLIFVVSKEHFLSRSASQTDFKIMLVVHILNVCYCVDTSTTGANVSRFSSDPLGVFNMIWFYSASYTKRLSILVVSKCVSKWNSPHTQGVLNMIRYYSSSNT